MIMLVGILTACSSQYQFNSNVDKDSIVDYFSASTVKVYADEASLPDKHRFIATVEGDDCQEQQHHAKPSAVNARTKARQQAYKLNTNAVIFSSCSALTADELAAMYHGVDNHQCFAITVCYGKAYIVKE